MRRAVATAAAGMPTAVPPARLAFTQVQAGAWQEAHDHYSRALEADPELVGLKSQHMAQARGLLQWGLTVGLQGVVVGSARGRPRAGWPRAAARMRRCGSWPSRGSLRRRARARPRLHCTQPSPPRACACVPRAQVACNRAAAAAKLGRHRDALADAELAIELDAGYAKAYVRRAQVRAVPRAGVGRAAEALPQRGTAGVLGPAPGCCAGAAPPGAAACRGCRCSVLAG